MVVGYESDPVSTIYVLGREALPEYGQRVLVLAFGPHFLNTGTPESYQSLVSTHSCCTGFGSTNVLFLNGETVSPDYERRAVTLQQVTCLAGPLSPSAKLDQIRSAL